MLRSIPIIFIFFLCVFSFNSFALDDENIIKELKEHVPKLEIEYVIQTANEYSKEQGSKTEEYFIQSVRYDSTQEEWTIFFNGKIPMPGNHFTIVINDRTKEIRLFPGM